MKTLRLHATGDLRLHDEPDPAPAEGEALLRVTAVGVCGSDLHWFSHSGIGDARLEQPLVLGHEFAAVRVNDGQRVAVDPAIPCGDCELCLHGHPNLCPQVRFAGHGRTGWRFARADDLACAAAPSPAGGALGRSTAPCWSRWGWRCMRSTWVICAWGCV